VNSVSVVAYLDQLNTTGSFPDENVKTAKVSVQACHYRLHTHHRVLALLHRTRVLYSYYTEPFRPHVSFRRLCPVAARIPYIIQVMLKAMSTALCRQVRPCITYF
jgi:hypothetical protein